MRARQDDEGVPGYQAATWRELLVTTSAQNNAGSIFTVAGGAGGVDCWRPSSCSGHSTSQVRCGWRYRPTYASTCCNCSTN